MSNSKKITLICDNCEKSFVRWRVEYERNLLLQRKTYCCRSCASDHRRGVDYVNSADNIYYIQKAASRAADWNKRTKHQDPLSNDDRLKLESHIEELWTGKCYYSGVSIHRRNWKGVCEQTTNPFFIASLDRIDNSKGYEVGNVVWCSYALNLARNTRLHEDYQSDILEFFKAQPALG